WDDFDEDTTYSGNEWVAVSGIRTFIDEDSSDEDNEMTSTVSGGWPKYALNDVNKWTWSNFALRVFCYDAQTGGPLQMKNVGWVMFRDTDPSNPGAGSPAAVHTRDDGTSWLAWDASYYAYEIPFILPFGSGTGVVEFLTDATAKAAPRLYDPPNNYKYKYPSQIRMWPGPPGSSTGAEASYDLDTHRALLPYNRKKTHNIVANGSNVTLTVYTPSNSASFTRSDMPSTPGRQSLYGDIVKVAWDDIRIIPPDGNFTSQVINSTLIPKLADASDFEWGTIASTVTIPSTASAASETVTIKTKSSSDADWTTPPGALGGESLASTKPASGAVSIQYKAFLATADTDINETPVLEDVTITYLPKVSIKSFSVSN
ncbi:MAG: hypothetical protein Q8R48_04705, partial [Candidatus Omnitrophota bacterium]|nr:hypothetical protein [Candidatus Omnitrophota bacterium]